MQNDVPPDRIYRSNPRYRLFSLAELPPHERRSLARVSDDATSYGVLVPLEPATLTVKLLNEETARLFQALVGGGRVPGERRSSALQLQLRDLVAAEILELEEGGAFRTGLAALPLLDGRLASSPAGGALNRLSREAIAYAESLRLPSPAAISDRIYAYHRIAVGASSRRRWSTEAVQAAIDALLHRGTDAGRWRALGRPVTWTSYARVGLSSDAGALGRLHKLYISPMPEQLLDALALTLDVIGDSDGVVGWKVGIDCYGFLRPDKLIVYVQSADALFSLAQDLLVELEGMSRHGVPFTAELGADGLLSWGVDPPRFSPGAAGLLSDSWRTWLTQRLAGALWQASQHHIADAVDLALLRLRAAGVDTDAWTPSQSLFDAG